MYCIGGASSQKRSYRIFGADGGPGHHPKRTNLSNLTMAEKLADAQDKTKLKEAMMGAYNCGCKVAKKYG